MALVVHADAGGLGHASMTTTDNVSTGGYTSGTV